MWSLYDGYSVTQAQVANWTGAWPCGVPPFTVVDAIRLFTNSMGYFAYEYDYVPGAQGDLMGACIDSIKDNVPVILPINGNSHAILITGFEWHEEPDGRPIGDTIFYNDPDGYVGQWNDTVANIEDNYWDSAGGFHYVLMGDSCYFYNGITGHDRFVFRKGTYYGGPSFYDPKGLWDGGAPEPEL